MRRHHGHELDGTTSGAEWQGPERVAARPVDHRVELGGEVGTAAEVAEVAVGFAGEGDQPLFGVFAGSDSFLAGDDRFRIVESLRGHKRLRRRMMSHAARQGIESYGFEKD